MIKSDQTLDCTGLTCPMPIVRTKKAIESMQAGRVLEIIATDKGSLADMQSWAKNTGHQYVGTIEEGEVLKHYLRKAGQHEVKGETIFPHTISNEALQDKLTANEDLKLLDVREPAEYAFQHIPGALSIPLGDLAERCTELNRDLPLYVICRTGNRSDLACRLLAEKGFAHVTNVLPGMSGWTGAIDSETDFK